MILGVIEHGWFCLEFETNLSDLIKNLVVSLQTSTDGPGFG